MLHRDIPILHSTAFINRSLSHAYPNGTHTSLDTSHLLYLSLPAAIHSRANQRAFTMLFASGLLLVVSLLTDVFAFPTSSCNSHRRAGVVPTLSGPTADMTSGQGGTYPRINFLSDGSIIGAFTAFSGGDNVLTSVHSTDSGASWTPIGTAASGPSASNDLDNPFPIQLPSGTVLLACRNHDFMPGSSPRVYTEYRITVLASTDHGATWSFLSTPNSHAATTTNNGLWEPFMRISDDGSLQLFYSEEDAADDQNTMMQVSTDGGSTWSAPVMVTGDGVTARDGMVGIATVSGRDLLMVFESVPPGGTFTVNAVSSTDDGLTWTDRRLVYAPTGSNNNAGAPQVVNVGGTLCVSFMTDEDTQDHMWITGAGAKLVTGTDGQTFGNKLEVFAPQTDWPGMLALDDGDLLYVADASGSKAQRISLS